jgi:hypothetical protein
MFDIKYIYEKRMKIANQIEQLQIEDSSLAVLEDKYHELEKEIDSALNTGLPKLVLPKLLPDHSDVDAKCNDHLKPQAEQILYVFKELSSKQSPLVSSKAIKKYILDNLEIEHPDYWRQKTSSKEPERWWKNIYDKCIERLDLVEGKVLRSSWTKKKGLYALREYALIEYGKGSAAATESFAKALSEIKGKEKTLSAAVLLQNYPIRVAHIPAR